MKNIQNKGSVVRARVGTVHVNKGYAVAYSLGTYGEVVAGKDITFSLDKWEGGSELPKTNQIIDLEEVTLFNRGWRAGIARPVVA
jgi:hypothetical protein